MTWTTLTATGLSNVHRRRYADTEAAWNLVLRVADPAAQVWPTDNWEPMLLEHGLTVGSSGGHGSVRYAVSAVEPDRCRFVFTAKAFTGFHEFRREGEEIVHELALERPSWIVRRVIMPLHDAVLEDLLDNVEDHLAGRPVPRKRTHSLFVRAVLALTPKPRQ